MKYSSRLDIVFGLEKKVLENICVISYDNKKLFTDSENELIQNIISNIVQLQRSLGNSD